MRDGAWPAGHNVDEVILLYETSGSNLARDFYVSDFRGFDFLLFLEIKFESNLSKTTFSRTKSQIEYHSFSLSSTGFHRIKQTSKNDNDRSDFIFIFFFDDSFLGR